MRLTLKREEFTENSTIGSLYIDGEFFCYTLEDTLRKDKIKGETAIPYGTYQVILSWSPRFKRILPLLISVPNFDGIRIHPGNTKDDTEGCLLVGESKGKDIIYNSRKAFTKLFSILEKEKDISIEIK
jgi:hypothetical protein